MCISNSATTLFSFTYLEHIFIQVHVGIKQDLFSICLLALVYMCLVVCIFFSHYVRHTSNDNPLKSRTPCFVYLLTFLSAIGGFLFGYDTGVIAGAIVLLELDFSLSSVWREAVVSIPMASAAVFSIVSDATNSRFGRKFTILVASGVFAVGAILLAASINPPMLVGGRLILGIGIGTSFLLCMFG